MKQQAAQVYFSAPVYLHYKALAKMENKPLAAWLREAADEKAKKSGKNRKKMTDLPSFSWDDGENNISERIDEIIYGRP